MKQFQAPTVPIGDISHRSTLLVPKVKLPKVDGFTSDMNFLIGRGNSIVTFLHRGIYYRVQHVALVEVGEYIVTYINFMYKEVKVHHVGTEGFKIFPRRF